MSHPRFTKNSDKNSFSLFQKKKKTDKSLFLKRFCTILLCSPFGRIYLLISEQFMRLEANDDIVFIVDV